MIKGTMEARLSDTTNRCLQSLEINFGFIFNGLV